MVKPNVTIFADASVDARTGAAGWGAWIKADGIDSISHLGSLREAITDVSRAELYAIANALVVARACKVLSGHVLVESDCAHALAMLLKAFPGAIDNPAAGGLRVGPRRRGIPSEAKPAIKIIRAIVAENRITLAVRHVRGHRPGDGRNWVNRACDKIARRHMRAARASMAA
jgi:ribonuclease HI